MQSTDIPYKIPTPWASGASSTYVQDPIPVPSQTGGRASFNDGFPSPNFVPILSGGVPPWGKDANGILLETTRWLRWIQAGGAPVTYDSTFQTAVGGYPLGAVVMSAITAGSMWLCTAENNTTNPDAAGAGWVPFPQSYGVATSKTVESRSHSAGVSGPFISNNSSGPPFTFTLLQTLSFTFPSSSPTGGYVLHAEVIAQMEPVTPLTGVTFGGWQEGQLLSLLHDQTNNKVLNVPVGWFHATTDVGGNFDSADSFDAGDYGTFTNGSTTPGLTTAGSATRTLRYAPGATITLAQYVALANTGSYPLGAGANSWGRMVVTAKPG